MKPHNQAIFAIHGGGNIGLGLMADIVSRSRKPYRIIATSGNALTNEIINCYQQFWLRHPSRAGHGSSQVNNINMVNAKNAKNIVRLYKSAKMGAICMTEEAVKKTAPLIAAGLINRYQSSQDHRNKLKLLVLMNKQHCDHFVQNEVAKAVKAQIDQSIDLKKVMHNVQFVPAVADRIVSKIPDEQVLDQIKEKLEHSNLARLNEIGPADFDDKLKFKCYLFNAESRFSLYVPHYLREAQEFPGITRVNDVNMFMTVKNTYINGPHAILAWLGGLMGHTTITKAIQNRPLRTFLFSMMKNEIAPILLAEFPQVNRHDLDYFRNLFIERCELNSTDTIKRVARDPLRKLNDYGCIRSLLRSKQKLNLKISTSHLEKGIAAGILYALKRIDPHNNECQKIVKIYEKHRSISAVLCYSGQYDGGRFIGFDPLKDKTTIQNILNHIQQKNMSLFS